MKHNGVILVHCQVFKSPASLKSDENGFWKVTSGKVESKVRKTEALVFRNLFRGRQDVLERNKWTFLEETFTKDFNKGF